MRPKLLKVSTVLLLKNVNNSDNEPMKKTQTSEVSELVLRSNNGLFLGTIL